MSGVHTEAMEQTRATEERSLVLLLRYFVYRDPVTAALRIKKGLLTKELQIKHGDILRSNLSRTGHVSIECKAEEKFTGNLFIEIFSDITARPQPTLGWLFYCEADILVYHFLDVDKAFLLHFPRFKNWFVNSGNNRLEWRVQEKHFQRNKTSGLLLPIDDVVDVTPPFYLGLIHPDSGQMDIDEPKRVEMLP